MLENTSMSKYYPMLAKAGKEDILGSTRYQYEYKLDGQRCLLYIQQYTHLGKPATLITLQSRSGRDMTANFPEVVESIASRQWVHSHVFDGEIVVRDADGRENFQALSTRMQRITSVGAHALKTRAEFVAFDVLVSYGVDITDWPLSARRERLQHYENDGSSFDITYVISPSEILDAYEAIKLDGREGVMAKLLTSPYRWGERSDEWLKIKPTKTMEVYIGGCTWGLGKRTNDFASLLVGVMLPKGEPFRVGTYPDNIRELQTCELRYIGQVGTGFTDTVLRDLRILIDDLECDDSPFIDYPTTTPQANDVRAYCRPDLRARVEYQELTKDGKLRFPSFKSLLSP